MLAETRTIQIDQIGRGQESTFGCGNAYKRSYLTEKRHKRKTSQSENREKHVRQLESSQSGRLEVDGWRNENGYNAQHQQYRKAEFRAAIH